MERRRAMGKWSALVVAGVIGVTGPMMLTGEKGTHDTAAAMGKPVVQAVAVEAEQQARQAASGSLPVSAGEPETHIDLTSKQRAELAAELDRWKTRHSRKLVDTIAELAKSQPLPLPPTYLLSIAWAETRGKVLAVSPAGAAGLAQATPAAYLLEGFDGKLYVTNQYLIGTRSYIMKKPLGDAMTISELLLERNNSARRRKARALLSHAIELRKEGMDELEALRPVANDYFFDRIAEADRHNLATLQELGRIIDRGAPRRTTKRFHDRVRRDYLQMMNVQRVAWARYGRQLETRRDSLLRAHFKQDPAQVIRTRPYTAGEYLGRHLDARFSPSEMASFLAAHLSSKQQQALELGAPEEKLDSWTAALYNGGAVNIKRMRAGLIDRLTETQKYMKLVPSRSEKLERAMGEDTAVM